MNHNAYPRSTPERKFATELSDGDQMYFHASDLAPVPQKEPEAPEPTVDVQPKTPEFLPHQLPRQFSNGIIRLRVIHQRETLGRAAVGESWDSFEEVNRG